MPLQSQMTSLRSNFNATHPHYNERYVWVYCSYKVFRGLGSICVRVWGFTAWERVYVTYICLNLCLRWYSIMRIDCAGAYLLFTLNTFNNDGLVLTLQMNYDDAVEDNFARSIYLVVLRVLKKKLWAEFYNESWIRCICDLSAVSGFTLAIFHYY